MNLGSDCPGIFNVHMFRPQPVSPFLRRSKQVSGYASTIPLDENLKRFLQMYFNTVKLHADYHAEVGHHLYSAPYALVGQLLETCMTTEAVLFTPRGQQVAGRPCNSMHIGLMTSAADTPEAHQVHQAQTLQRLI